MAGSAVAFGPAVDAGGSPRMDIPGKEDRAVVVCGFQAQEQSCSGAEAHLEAHS